MTSIKLTLTGAQAQAQVEGILTAGMVGIPVTISYDEQWEGLSKTLICKSAAGQRCVIGVEESATVAPEVMYYDPLGKNELWLGVEGRSADGTLVFPSTMTRCGEILPGASTKEIEIKEGHGALWAQIMDRIGNMKLLATSEKDDLVSAINEVFAQGPAGKMEGPLIATVTDNGDGTGSLDKTFEEIKEAIENGKMVFASLDGGYLPLRSFEPTASVVFGYQDVYVDDVAGRQVIWYVGVFLPIDEEYATIMRDEDVSGSAMLVNVSGSESTGYTADRPFTEVKTAILSGQPVYMCGSDNLLYPFLFASGGADFDQMTFGMAMAVPTSNGISFLTRGLSMSDDNGIEFAENDRFIDTLKNPMAMTINGTTYDGSSFVNYTDTINSMIDAKIKVLDATGVSY